MSGECNICGDWGCVEANHSPAQQAKRLGLKSLTQASQITGVSLSALTNWHRSKPELFRIILLGCVVDRCQPELGFLAYLH